MWIDKNLPDMTGRCRDCSNSVFFSVFWWWIILRQVVSGACPHSIAWVWICGDSPIDHKILSIDQCDTLPYYKRTCIQTHTSYQLHQQILITTTLHSFIYLTYILICELLSITRKGGSWCWVLKKYWPISLDSHGVQIGRGGEWELGSERLWHSDSRELTVE